MSADLAEGLTPSGPPPDPVTGVFRDGQVLMTIPLDLLLGHVYDGDEHGWETEFGWLESRHGRRIDALATSLQMFGQRWPVDVGDDHRCWDGHHRLAAAHLIALHDVLAAVPPDLVETLLAGGARLAVPSGSAT